MTVDLFKSFFMSKSEARRDYRRFLSQGPRQFKTDWADIYRKHRQFYNTLNYLQHEGLVVKKEKGKSSFWNITKRGIERLRYIRDRSQNNFSKFSVSLDPPTGSGLIIVAFDIPEKERRARDWVRACLREMEFKLLQKSVWVSRGNAIDEDFIHAIRERKLLPHVHIFSVNKRGTIHEI